FRIDLVSSGFQARTAQKTAERFTRELHIDLAPCQRRIGEQLYDRAFELSNRRSAVAGDEIEHLLHSGYFEAVVLGPFTENRDTRLEVRQLDVGDQSPLESG